MGSGAGDGPCVVCNVYPGSSDPDFLHSGLIPPETDFFSNNCLDFFNLNNY